MNRRLFVGAPVAPHTGMALHDLQDQFLKQDSLRMVPVENFHATLCFLGSVEEQSLEQLSSYLQKVATEQPPFQLHWDDLHVVQKGSAGMVWAQLEATETWHRLVEDVRTLCRPFMQQDFSFAEQIPHITLARWKIEAPQLPTLQLPSEPFLVESMCLYESHQDQRGSRYTIRDTYSFSV